MSLAMGNGLAPPGSPVAAASPPGQPDGELVIVGNGQKVAGWERCSVRRGVEIMPSSYTVDGTVRFPGEMREVIPLNSPIQIMIGGHVVITGYMERITARIGPEDHGVTMTGRGRCCDLVDGAAVLTGMSRTGASIGSLAKDLVAPFAGPISVVLPDGDGDGKNFVFNINLGETVFEIIERIARYEGLLVYEDENGNLVLSRVGTAVHASGFVQGENVQAAERYDNWDQRFSEYIPALMSADTIGARAPGSNSAGAPVYDKDITRYRPRYIVSEQAQSGVSLAQVRATWEALRRKGRATRVVVTCDSWLDVSGVPWTPNMLAPVALPAMGIEQQNMIITEVEYKRDGQSGTTAVVTLMLPGALTVEPSQLDAISAKTLDNNGPVGTPNPPAPPVTAPNATPTGAANPRGAGL